MIVRLGDYVNIRTGKLDANASSENGMYPFFTCSKEPLKIDTFSYDCECVLVAGNGDLNVKYYNGKFDAYQRTYIVESNNHEVLHVKYLYYFLDKYVETLRRQSIGGVIKYIKLGNITNAKFPLPEIEKQHRISENLDKVSDLIAKRKQQLEKLDLLVKSRFAEMFGDDLQKNKSMLSKVAKISGGLTKNSKRELLKLKMPYIRVANVFFNRLDLREILEIGVNESEVSKTLLKKGDLLFVEGNGSIEQIGRVAIWNDDIKPCLHQNHLIKARFNTNIINPTYALFYFMSDEGRKQIVSKSVSTSGLNTLSVRKIECLELPITKIELQNQFAEFVQQTEQTKTIINQSLEKLETLKIALMQEYFG